jgi:hypothetical protein
MTHPFTRARSGAAVLATVACLASTSSASDDDPLADVPTPERVAGFKEALRTFAASDVDFPVPADTDLLILTSYDAPAGLPPLIPGVRADIGGRDLVFEERFLVAGREQDFERAARRWLSRQLDGPRVAAIGGRGGSRAHVGWHRGPTLGIAAGPLRAHVESGSWRLKVTGPRLRVGRGTWSISGYAGESDGDVRVGFLLGRSLLESRSR